MEEFCGRIDEALRDYGTIRAVADTLHVKPIFVCAAGLIFVLGFFLYGIGGHFICTVVGVAYPAFESFKVLEVEDEQVMNFWLTYWVVFSTVTLCEHISYYFLVWFPFYYPLKLGLLLWLFLPSSRGAIHIYRLVVHPILERNRPRIDSAIDESTTRLKKTIKDIPSIRKGAFVAGANGIGRLRKAMNDSSNSVKEEDGDAIRPEELFKERKVA
mmetsp:Transcript_22769/g.50328  ORF Transcript_22769/g.50328 Transcript_22769/m.50328 type:complete len:214 (+) Transcript_22769:47-688(+)